MTEIENKYNMKAYDDDSHCEILAWSIIFRRQRIQYLPKNGLRNYNNFVSYKNNVLTTIITEFFITVSDYKVPLRSQQL